jgi:hypothetical protein
LGSRQIRYIMDWLSLQLWVPGRRFGQKIRGLFM